MSASAFPQQASSRITVEKAWVRLSAPGTRTTAAYMVIRNTGDKALRILQVECPVAGVAELHNHFNDGGIMRMRAIPALSIEGRGEAKLDPGGLHIMLVDLKVQLKAGDLVPIVLRLEDGSRKTVEALVKDSAAELLH